MSICVSRKKLALIALGLAVLVAGAVAALLLASPETPEQSHHSSIAWVVLVPIYASFVPVYVAAARRRRNKKKNG